MKDMQSTNITIRFFKALDYLIVKGELKGIQSFTRLYDIDKRNLYRTKKDPNKHQVKLSWIHYMVNDFGVSAEWLITGKGKAFN